MIIPITQNRKRSSAKMGCVPKACSLIPSPDSNALTLHSLPKDDKRHQNPKTENTIHSCRRNYFLGNVDLKNNVDLSGRWHHFQ